MEEAQFDAAVRAIAARPRKSAPKPKPKPSPHRIRAVTPRRRKPVSDLDTKLDHLGAQAVAEALMKTADDTSIGDVYTADGLCIERDYAEDWLLRRELEASEQMLWNRMRHRLFVTYAMRTFTMVIAAIALLAFLADQ